MNVTFRKVKGLKPHVDVFSKRLHENMTRLWNDATKAFLDEIVKNDLVKVDTGMSRASLIPLARAVRMLTVVRASIHPKHASKKGAFDINGTWDPNGVRDVEHGIKLGERAYKLNYGSQQHPVFYFEFNIKVYQYWYNESFSNGTNSAGWESLEKATAAFDDYIRNNASLYVPKLAEWILPEGGIR